MRTKADYTKAFKLVENGEVMLGVSYKPGGIDFTTSVTKPAYNAIIQEAQNRIAFCLQNEACFSREVLVESAHNQNMTISGVGFFEIDREEQVRLHTMLLVNLIILQQMDPEHCKSQHTGLAVLAKRNQPNE